MVPPGPGGEELVAAEAGEQRAPARRLEQRELEERVGRIEDAVAPKHGGREWSQAVHLVAADLSHLPLTQAEVADDALLPSRFLAPSARSRPAA